MEIFGGVIAAMEQNKRPNHRPFKDLHISKELTDSYYTIQEVADILKVHHQTVRKMIREGRLPAEQMGTVWRIRKDDLEKVFK